MADVEPVAPPRRHTWVFWLMLAAAIGALAFWLLFRRDPLPAEIRIAAGSPGGLYHKIAEELAVRIQANTGKPVRVLDTKGTVDNRERLIAGEADLAIFQAGAAPMDGLAGLAPLYPDMVFVIVRKGSGIRSIEQLEGRRISIGEEGSGMRAMAIDLLSHYGVNPASLQKTDLYFTDLLKDPGLEGAVVTAGLLNKDLESVMKTRKFELVPIVDGPALAVRNRVLNPAQVPRGVFAEGPPVPAKDVPTISTTAMLVSRADAHGALVTAALNATYRGDLQMVFPILVEEQEAKTRTIYPVHAAARKYHNPYEGLDTIAGIMESMSAGKELLVAIGASVYLLWDQLRRRREREREKAIRAQREQLDQYLNETVRIEKAQIGCWDRDELRAHLEEVTRIKLEALESLTEEKLREDRMFLIFITQCSSLITKMQNKMISGYQPGEPALPSQEIGQRDR